MFVAYNNVPINSKSVRLALTQILSVLLKPFVLLLRVLFQKQQAELCS